MRTKEWFLERIGKRVYRTPVCPCTICTDIQKNGMIITDQKHAEYIYTVQADLRAEDLALLFFDTKEERDNYDQRTSYGTPERA